MAENCLLYLTRKFTFILNVRSTCTICVCTGTCKMKWQKLSFFTKQPLFSQLVVLSTIVIANNCLINGNRYKERVLCVAYQKRSSHFMSWHLKNMKTKQNLKRCMPGLFNLIPIMHGKMKVFTKSFIMIRPNHFTLRLHDERWCGCVLVVAQHVKNGWAFPKILRNLPASAWWTDLLWFASHYCV